MWLLWWYTPKTSLHGPSPTLWIVTDSINAASESSQLPVIVTVCISVNIYYCKPYISLCFSFLALQGHNTGDEETKGLTWTFYHTQDFIKQRKESPPQQPKIGFSTKKSPFWRRKKISSHSPNTRIKKVDFITHFCPPRRHKKTFK